MIETSIYISYSVAGAIITTIISSLCYFDRRKMCKKEIVLQAEGITPMTPVELVLEVNNNDIEQWPIVN